MTLKDKAVILLLRLRGIWWKVKWELQPKTRKQKIQYHLMKAMDQANGTKGLNTFMIRGYIGGAIRELDHQWLVKECVDNAAKS